MPPPMAQVNLLRKMLSKLVQRGARNALSSIRGKEITLNNKNPIIDLNPSTNIQKMIENGTLKSENILPFSAPNDKIHTKRQNYDHLKTRNPCEMAIIDPIVKPVSRLENEKVVDKSNILLNGNDSIEKKCWIGSQIRG